MKIKIISIFVCSIFLLVPKAIIAQSTIRPQGLTVFPAVIEVNSAKGQANQSSFTIINNSDQPLPVNIEVRSIIPADKIIDLSKRSQFDASRWISVTPQNVALEPGQSKRIELFLDVPAEATAGGHYAEILVKDLKLNDNQGQAPKSDILKQLKIPVFINLDGEIKEELIIESGDKFGQIYQKNTTYTTKFNVANTGNTHILPTFNINFIKDGKAIQSESFVPGVILPNTTKEVNHSWQAIAPIGLYEIQISANYGQENKTLVTEKERAIVIPNIFMLAFLVILSFLIMYLINKRKNVIKAVSILFNNR